MNRMVPMSVLCLLTPTLIHAADKNPNVVFILADDLGTGDLSAYNPDSRIKTPVIDSLCQNGVIFTDAHATSSLSTPSRYSILTGRYSWRTTLKQGVLSGYSPAMIPADRSTMASMFSQSGYATACIGKWHLGWDWKILVPEERSPKGKKLKDPVVDFSQPIKNGPTERGFDYFYGISGSLDMPPYVYVENDRPTAEPHAIAQGMKGLRLFRSGPIAPDFDVEDCLSNQLRRSVQYIESRKGKEQPFFLYMPLTAPHTPILPSEEFQGKTVIGPYGDFVTMIDHLVGEIVSALRRSNLLDDTIIVFTSDNGGAKAARPQDMIALGHYPNYIYRGTKRDIFEGGHRIPLIVSWHGKLDARTDKSLVSLSDLYATFAEMTGYELEPDEAEDSYSLWKLIAEQGQSPRPDLVSLSGFGFFSIRTPQYKLIFTAGSGGDSFPYKPEDLAGLPPMQLYDIQNDPAEKKNLIDDPQYKEMIAEMTALMRQYVLQGRSTPGIKQKNDTPDKWRQNELFM